MAKSDARWWKLDRKFLIFMICLVLSAAGAVGQGNSSLGTENAEESEVSKSSGFDVVSIRPHQRKPWELARTVFTPDGFTSTNSPLYVVLIVAYDLRDPTLIGTQPGGHLSRIPGAPDWTYSDLYDIAAKMSDSDVTELKALGPEQRTARMRLMLQTLLADRFNLKVHSETRDVPSYDLVVTSRGPKKMKKEPDSEALHLDWRGRTHLTAHALSLADLAKPILTGQMGCQVEDKTGLSGKYDFTLDWSVDSTAIASPETGNAPAPEPAGPSIFTALQEQLGLRLKPTKTPIESIVIDHIERPSEN